MTHAHDTEVDTDPRRLERIVTNLVANARRHSRPPIEVHLDDFTVTVRDRGAGYPKDLLDDGPSASVRAHPSAAPLMDWA